MNMIKRRNFTFNWPTFDRNVVTVTILSGLTSNQIFIMDQMSFKNIYFWKDFDGLHDLIYTNACCTHQEIDHIGRRKKIPKLFLKAQKCKAQQNHVIKEKKWSHHIFSIKNRWRQTAQSAAENSNESECQLYRHCYLQQVWRPDQENKEKM